MRQRGLLLVGRHPCRKFGQEHVKRRSSFFNSDSGFELLEIFGVFAYLNGHLSENRTKGVFLNSLLFGCFVYGLNYPEVSVVHSENSYFWGRIQ